MSDSSIDKESEEQKDQGTIVIKRYANRKLYNTNKSCYVTLHEISEMVSGGGDVKIIDYKTKKDITSVTLAQIIFEKEKTEKVLPSQTLKSVLRQGEKAVSDFLTRTVTLGEEIRGGAERKMDALEKIIVRNTGDSSRFVKENMEAFQTNLEEFNQKLEDKIAAAWGSKAVRENMSDDIDRLGRTLDRLEAKMTAFETVLIERGVLDRSEKKTGLQSSDPKPETDEKTSSDSES